MGGTHLFFSKEENSRFYIGNFEGGKSLGKKVHFLTSLGQPKLKEFGGNLLVLGPYGPFSCIFTHIHYLAVNVSYRTRTKPNFLEPLFWVM